MSSTQVPYIVMLGDVGAGKSTILEKLTGTTGRSSNSSTSYTHTAEVFQSFDGRLIICDTPGSNATKDKFGHNIHIAHAIKFRPVTCILIVVKAEVRIDNVVTSVKEYSERFIPDQLPISLIAVCVTHMDLVTWKKAEFLEYLSTELGIETAVTSSKFTSRETLCNDILQECKKKRPVPIEVDSDTFLKLFKIGNSNLKVLRSINHEVSLFKLKVDKFLKQFQEYQTSQTYGYEDRMNMIFDFQSLMLEEIIEIQKRVSKVNKFEFTDENKMVIEAGHLANMTNQLRQILSVVRIEASQYHKEVDTGFRKCPFCNTIWQKSEGCDDLTNCGSRPFGVFDVWSGEMSSFKFTWNEKDEIFWVRKLAADRSRSAARTSDGVIEKAYNAYLSESVGSRGTGIGCGNFISWSKMAPVPVSMVPVKFDHDISSTHDVKTIPQPARRSWNVHFDAAIDKLQKLQVKPSVR